MECPEGHKNCPIIHMVMEELKKAAPRFSKVSHRLRQRRDSPEREEFDVGVKIINNIITKTALLSGGKDES